MSQHQHKSATQRVTLVIFFTCVTMVLYSFSTPYLQASPRRLPRAVPCTHQTIPIQKREFPHASKGPREVKSCKPKVDLMFLKTHKTASSTILNILLRFGQRNHLKFALPNSRNDFFYPSRFVRTQVKDYVPGVCYNIICNHMRFNAEEVEALLPNDAFFFTILREPAMVFESSFHYFKKLVPLTWMIRGEDKLTVFLSDPNRYFTTDGFNAFYLKNVQFFDLGYDNNLNPEDPIVEQAIHAISDRFQLILIAEYFEESLILLKDALCWETDDLLFFKLNARRSTSVAQLTPELRAKAHEWNSVDWKLYRHFNATFWARVDTYGRKRMERDVKELRRRNMEMSTICIDGGMAVEERDIRDESMKPWQPVGENSILGYNLRTNIDQQYSELCRKMLMPEIQYLTELGVNLWLTQLWSWFKYFLAL
ncbi:galactosylceramide sulfotransferase [Electrophorus electricus]|uniref:galactosylceramide sulfotransferase n=1 Tax=Electrophorus electricus TaxID=8005 RepID=UPI0015D072A9|nr:galactosylceramide sulfotransferase [Electrophorus electricus]